MYTLSGSILEWPLESLPESLPESLLESLPESLLGSDTIGRAVLVRSTIRME
jgi:hypothetical protein